MFEMENSASMEVGEMGSLGKKLKANVIGFFSTLRRLGKEDPRRIVHGFKVGLAVSLVSFFYTWMPHFSILLALLSVLAVFEYSVGATIGKGINMMVGTFLGGSLALLIHHLANPAGHIGEPVLIGICGFLIFATMAFIRFYPSLKARYDFGLMIFILAFSFILVLSYREVDVIKIAHQTLTTIAIGICIAMLVCTCICPVWIGSELHNCISNNLDKLGSVLVEFGGEYFDVQSEGESKGEHKDKLSLQNYKSVLDTETTEEIRANLAAWEPCHGQFKFLHPWKQYLKIGALLRQCAYRIDFLNHYLNPNVNQGPRQFRIYIKEACTTMSSELGKAMKDLAIGLKKMEKTSSTSIRHINKAKSASEDLMFILNTNNVAPSGLWKDYNVLDILPCITVASLLLDVVSCVDKITELVHQLDSLAGFKPTVDGNVVTQLNLEEIYEKAELEEGRNGHGFEDNNMTFCGSEELNYVGIEIVEPQSVEYNGLETTDITAENKAQKM